MKRQELQLETKSKKRILDDLEHKAKNDMFNVGGEIKENDDNSKDMGLL